MYPKIAILPLLALLLAGCVEDTGAVMAPTGTNASDLSTFQGAKAGQAEMGIQNLGFRPVRSDGLTTWWVNPDSGACARITTSDGRYSDVTMLPAGDC